MVERSAVNRNVAGSSPARGANLPLFRQSVIGGGSIRRAATEVAVSNRRVLIKRAFFSRRSIEVLLPKVESIGVDESLFGRMLGYGTVIVRGTGGAFETFDKIARPSELRRQVQQQTGNAVSA